MSQWFRKSSRKPLIVRGARQVGKSTLIRQFAETEGLRLFEVNVERHPFAEADLVLNDPRVLIQEIEYRCNQGQVNREDSLLFFDEIQAQPALLPMLRYFYEDHPELAVVSAGSLLEFALADHSFSMPVGRVEYFHMGPVGWEEYLEALGESDLLGLLNSFQPEERFPMAAHQRLLTHLRNYLLVGGFPEPCASFLQTGDLQRSFELQHSISATYRDDFPKYAGATERLRLERVLDYLGAHVGEKVKYSTIDPDSRSKVLREAIELLNKAGLLISVSHSAANAIPLGAEVKDKIFKLYFLDLAFLNRATGLVHLPPSELQNPRWVNEGKLAEQFVAQNLYGLGYPESRRGVYYWLREGRQGNAEVDFLVEVGGRICPVEVKAGAKGRLRSLMVFMQEKQCPVGCRLDLNPPSVQELVPAGQPGGTGGTLISLPIYAVEQVPRVCGLSMCQ